MEYYAHTKGPDKSEWQPLIDHLKNTAKLAYDFGQDAGVSDFSYLAGLIHDLGKYSAAFQRRLEGSKHSVDHSTAGAQELDNQFRKTPKYPIALLLTYCIAGHHTGLPDYGSPIDVEGDGTLISRLKCSTEDYSAYSKEIDFSGLKFPDKFSICPLKKHQLFSVSFFTRMVYSTLVDADFQDTEEFVQGKKPRGEYESIETLCQRFNEQIKKLSNPENDINRIRTQTLNYCIEKAIDEPGFFTLTVPTGGGKTLSSMAFALNHAIKNGLKRIIYVIPFTSIIEQNAAVFREYLGEGSILEQHSNFDWEQVNKDSRKQSDDWTNNVMDKLKLASENWDIPIIVTTNVQFFESIFANRSSKCRKIHNIAKSVIIFDEAQMLPREYLIPSMSALWEFVKNYHSSVVFCTATQPSLKRFMPEGTQFTELTENSQELFNFYRRVQLKYLGKLPDADLLDQMNHQIQSLCIVNTRKHAKGLFDGLIDADNGRFHLSTLMCPTHRKEKLQEIRQRLRDGKPCRVVSTQVMEAGIDVDFPVGYRAMAGLDSIIQAAGRVNRERKQSSGIMYVFDSESEFVKRVPAFVEQGAAVARSILREYSDDPVSIEAINAYFERLYSLQDGDRSFDANEIMACFEKGEGFYFKTAAEQFHLIDKQTQPIIIPYNSEAEKLIEELKFSQFPLSIVRKLQMFSVNVYEQEYNALNNQGAIYIVAENYPVLNNIDLYDKHTGLIIPEIDTSNAIFY